MENLKAQDFYNEIKEFVNEPHFTKLTNTGITTDYKSIFEFAEAYFDARMEASKNNTLDIKSNKIFVNYRTQPILHIEIKENGQKFGLNRDRNPDRDWTELRLTNMESGTIKEVELDSNLKQILIEDLAYAYGNDSTKFAAKLKEFGFMQNILETQYENNINIVRATTPKEFDVTKHRVIKFTRRNYKGYYSLNPDGYYNYKGESSAESSIHYTEDALLAYDNITVVEYISRL